MLNVLSAEGMSMVKNHPYGKKSTRSFYESCFENVEETYIVMVLSRDEMHSNLVVKICYIIITNSFYVNGLVIQVR